MSEMQVQPPPASGSFSAVAAALGLPPGAPLPGGADPATLAAWTALDPAITRDLTAVVLQEANRALEGDLGTGDVSSYVATDDSGAAALQDPGDDPSTIAV